MKYCHSIKGKDNVYTILKQYNQVKEFELLKNFSIEIYEFELIGKIVNIGTNVMVELYCNDKLLYIIKDDKLKYVYSYIHYLEDGREYSKDIEIDVRLVMKK